VAEGEFHETMNLAALWALPVLFVCENNLYAMGTALPRHQANPDIAGRAATYGMPAEAVDGMDVVAVEAAARRAVAAMRAEPGPRFLECRTYRFRAHSMFDAELYRDKAEVREWRKRDPVARFREWLVSNNLLHEEEIAALEAEVEQEVANAVAAAEQAPWEPVDELERHVTAETRPPPPVPPAGGRDGRDDVSRGGEGGDHRCDDPRRAGVPDGRGRRRLWRHLRRHQGPAR
jgi:2-oxoisovalerate dehydrogenase E1 component